MRVYELSKDTPLNKQMTLINKNVIPRNVYIVLVHAHWCSACKLLLPTWYKVLSKLKQVDIDVVHIDDVSSQEIHKLKDKGKKPHIFKDVLRQVKYYPSLFVVEQDGANDVLLHFYQGIRDEKNLSNFVKTFAKKLKPQ